MERSREQVDEKDGKQSSSGTRVGKIIRRILVVFVLLIFAMVFS